MRRIHVISCGIMGLLALFFLVQCMDAFVSTDILTNDDELQRRSHARLPLTKDYSLSANSSESRCTRFLYNESTGAIAGNGRAILALLLTSMQYHGVNRLKETLPTWMGNYLMAQGNVDFVLFYAYPVVTAKQLVETFGLVKAQLEQLNSFYKEYRDLRTDVEADITLTAEEWDSLGDGYYYLPTTKPIFVFRIVPVNLTFPLYIQKNWSLLEDPTWLRCGCPPFCPLHRSPPDYIQGTRWYSHGIFDQPIVQRYSFWVKLDVDVAFFRSLDNNLVHLLLSKGRLLGHTGYTYNGRGCSDELQDAINKFLTKHNMQGVSAGKDWWLSDDRTYYTNFVVGSVNFFLHPQVRSLTAYLNEYYNGFFKHRWTDQSLLHKVMGVFCGPEESDFALNWDNLRCTKKRTTPDAVFYHSKRKKKIRPGRPCRN
ncbi:putative glycosyltransferase family 15 [Trypanosoma theileri]|uniref:Putative glycosyltransferase family 15 n=1 Tax=Trypanosoma theileri TaxID=67003 RepID=A0A1X0P6G5_9TRYP|nr:putative glycosyltransferase family 15 [Trypanosoma theileri]ORC92534.1 putative glycosyltransferase family 15 [Trypanosoma theileri]